MFYQHCLILLAVLFLPVTEKNIYNIYYVMTVSEGYIRYHPYDNSKLDYTIFDTKQSTIKLTTLLYNAIVQKNRIFDNIESLAIDTTFLTLNDMENCPMVRLMVIVKS